LAGTLADPGIDPFQFGNGVLVWGTLSVHGAERAPGFERLAREALAGDTELVLSSVLDGWRAGDRIFLPDSRLLVDADMQHVETKPYNLDEPRDAGRHAVRPYRP
jgi:hypothetical protein